MASKVTREKIREALREGWKAPEIMELYGISHHRVTKERKYLGMGKWRWGKATTLGLTDIDSTPTVAQLRQEITKLKEDNRKLRDELTQAVYQHRNWQPNSLVRTSLANGG